MRFNGGGDTVRPAEEGSDCDGMACVGTETGSEESFRRFRGPSSSWLAPFVWVVAAESWIWACFKGQLGLVQLSPAGQGISLKFRKTASMVFVVE